MFIFVSPLVWKPSSTFFVSLFLFLTLLRDYFFLNWRERETHKQQFKSLELGKCSLVGLKAFSSAGFMKWNKNSKIKDQKRKKNITFVTELLWIHNELIVYDFI